MPPEDPSGTAEPSAHLPGEGPGKLRGRTYETLHEIAVAAGGQRDPGALARLAVEQARDLLAADNAGLYWWDADRAVLMAMADTFFRPDSLHSLRPGQGAAGRAFESGEPVLVSDYQSWDGAVQSMAARGVMTAAAVPVRVGTRCLGALVVRRREPLPFETAGIGILELLAAQVGAAIEAAHLLIEADFRRVEAESLAEIVRVGAAETDPDRVVSFISEQACRLVGSDFAAIALSEPDGTYSWHGVWGNRSDLWQTLRFRGRDGPAHVALLTGQTMVFERLATHPDYPPGRLRVIEAEGGRTILATPTLSGDEKLGALLLGWRTDVSPTSAQVHLSESLAGYAATVIANARAHTAEQQLAHEAEARAAESERRRLEAEALAEIVRLGAAETDPERVVSFISEQACRLLGADFASMALSELGGTWSWHGLWGNRSDTWSAERTFRTSRGPAKVALETRQTVVTGQFGPHLDFSPRALEILTAEGTHTLMATPTFSGDERLGVLLLGWRTDLTPTSAQIRLAEALAGYAATVIANARAHAAEQELTRQAEARATDLTEARRRLETLVSNLPGVAYRCRHDATWRMEFISNACLALTGYEPADFVEQRVTFLEIIHPDDLQRVAEEIEEALRAHRPFAIPYRLIVADGTEKHVWEQGVGVWSTDGTLLAREGFIRDVTERHRAREALLASEARFRRLAENAKDVIWRWEVKGTVGISYASPAATELFGYTAEDLYGDPGVTERVVHPDDVPIVASILRGEHAGESMVLRALHKDGRAMWVEHRHVNVYDEDGDLIAIEGIARDITERKQLEEQLLRAQRLEAAGRIAGQVAHDFNNLLAPLVGYPELIKSRLPADHPAQQFCDAMVDAASKMASINEDLLALGRRGSFDQVPMELNRLVGRALDQTPLLPEGITVERELAEDLLPIRASAPQLLRVLVNLFANALEAMADSGALTVRTANVYLDTSAAGYDRIERGEYVRLDVQDTGTGIAPEIRTRIFDAFFTTKVAGRRRGSGLGLSVVQAIVEDHGALLDLQTEVGKGTTFSLYFPVARERILEATAEGVKGGTESVLIVDDDPGQREVAQEILASLGYSVDAVSSGKEAVERMRVSPADLVLVDMVMEGGIDGAETLKRIQRVRPDQRAIIFSGFAESERIRTALASGAALFLRKPVTLARLAQAVRQVLDEPSGATAC